MRPPIPSPLQRRPDAEHRNDRPTDRHLRALAAGRLAPPAPGESWRPAVQTLGPSAGRDNAMRDRLLTSLAGADRDGDRARLVSDQPQHRPAWGNRNRSRVCADRRFARRTPEPADGCVEFRRTAPGGRRSATECLAYHCAHQSSGNRRGNERVHDAIDCSRQTGRAALFEIVQGL